MDKIDLIAQNKKAYHDYFISDTYEAGIELYGTEIKALRMKGASFNDAYCEIKNNEIFVKGLHITKYEMGNIFNHDPDRIKRLLLHKIEITRLNSKKTKDGYTIIPLKLYIKNGLAKLEIGVAKGKKLYDKRETIKENDEKIYINKMIKEKNNQIRE